MSAPFLNFLDRASIMIDRGVPVAPLPPCKKFPPPKGWQDFATTDIETINGWIVSNGQPAIAFEDSNCACVASLDGFWFWDIDDLRIVTAQVEKETGYKIQEIQTLVVRSSGESRHIYFKHNAASRALGNFSYKDANQAEIFSVRANGEYVVSPRSIHPDTGAEYQITRDLPIIEAPVWLTDWLKTIKRVSAKRAAKLLTDETAKVYEGGRDDFLFAEACKCRDTKMSQKAALAALMVTNNDRRVPPMDEAVVRIKIKSAYTRDARKQQNAETYVEYGTSPTAKPNSADKPAGVNGISRTASSIKPHRLKWLWEKRIPLSKIALFAGNPDNGKSLAANSIAATLTTGRPFPDFPNMIPPSDVLMMLGEDDLEDTAIPRLMAAGADLNKIHFLEGVMRGNKSGDVRLDVDMPVLEKKFQEFPNARLLIIDPISNFLGDTNMFGEQDVRAKVLVPLKQLAAKYKVAVIIVMHLNKKQDLDAISRVGGAMAFIGIARCSWLFVRDEASEDGTLSENFTMSRMKNNLTAASLGGLAYQIKFDERVFEDEDGTVGAPYVAWGSIVQKSADQALGTGRREVGRPKGSDSKMKSAIGFLEDALVDGRRIGTELFDEANHVHSITKRTLERAKDELHLRVYKEGKAWFWELPPMNATTETVTIAAENLEPTSTLMDVR